MSATARMMAFLGLDPKDFNKGIDSAHGKVGGFAKSLDGIKGKLAAAFTVGAALKIGKDALAMGDMIGELAGNLAMTTEEVQSLSFLFKTTGSSAETFERAVNKVNGAIGDVNNLVPGAREKLEKMGVTLDMIDVGPAKVLERMGQYLVENANSAAATADVYDILGDRVKNMTNGLVELGTKGLAAVNKAAADAGKVLDKNELDGLGKTQDALDSVIEYGKKRAAALVASGINLVVKPKMQTMAEYQADTGAVSTGPASRRKADEEAAAKITKETAEIRRKTEYDALSTAEKRLSIEQEIADLDKKIESTKTIVIKQETVDAQAATAKSAFDTFDDTALKEFERKRAELLDESKALPAGEMDGRVTIYLKVIPLEKQITEEKRKQSELEKIAEEKRKQAEAAKAATEKSVINPLTQLALLDKQKAELEGRLAGLKNPAIVAPPTDQFTRIGGGVGPVGGAAMDLSTPKKTLTVIQKMQIDMAKLVDYAAKQKSGVF